MIETKRKLIKVEPHNPCQAYRGTESSQTPTRSACYMPTVRMTNCNFYSIINMLEQKMPQKTMKFISN